MVELATSSPVATALREPRLWRRATLWLAGLGAFFYAGYGFTNWLASLRRDVPVVVFGWESAVPFLAWTIIPYWSTNLLFILSLYLCRSRRELDVQARRLLSAQAIAFVFFVAVPLRVHLRQAGDERRRRLPVRLARRFRPTVQPGALAARRADHRAGGTLCPHPAALGGRRLRPVVRCWSRHPF